MQNVPKIVSERLRAAVAVADTSVVNHPDADVLTAFSERSLPDRERAVVLAHLASCGDCRDVIALALPVTEEAQPVISPARSGWFTWPALRWGFAAAGLAVIASFGVIEYQRYARDQATVANVAEPRAESPGSQSQAQTPAAAPSAEPKREDPKSMQPAKTSAQAVNGVPMPSAAERISKLKSPEPTLSASAARPSNSFHGSAFGATGGITSNRQIAGGPNMPAQWQQQQRPSTSGRASLGSTVAAKQQPAPVPDIPSVSETVTVVATVPATQAETSEVQTAKAQAVQSQPAPQASNQPQAVSDETSALVVDESADLVSKAKPATTMRANATRNVPPHWAISSAGTLQRSFDQGKTWHDVDVLAKLASGDLKSYASSSSETVARAKEKDNAGDKKVSAAPIASPIFRAVSVNGGDVWAGGSSAALYHSLDAGNHWRQIVPTSDGASLTGDVISLEFSDARQGRIRTSTGETWMTTDDGQTWQKQ